MQEKIRCFVDLKIENYIIHIHGTNIQSLIIIIKPTNKLNIHLLNVLNKYVSVLTKTCRDTGKLILNLFLSFFFIRNLHILRVMTFDT